MSLFDVFVSYPWISLSVAKDLLQDMLLRDLTSPHDQPLPLSLSFRMAHFWGTDLEMLEAYIHQLYQVVQGMGIDVKRYHFETFHHFNPIDDSEMVRSVHFGFTPAEIDKGQIIPIIQDMLAAEARWPAECLAMWQAAGWSGEALHSRCPEAFEE